MKKFAYLSRIFSAYVLKKNSQLTFWHGEPEINHNIKYDKLGEFYQVFSYKADYPGPFDDNGVIILDYHGNIGKQKYHIAISQYGIACYNRFKRTNDREWFKKFMNQVQWHKDNIERNSNGIYLYYADFEWDYHGRMKKHWASGLAQGNALSLLSRAFDETGDNIYLELCDKIFTSIITDIDNGGVLLGENGDFWIEETLTPPMHILNGFMWSIMGVYDYWLISKNPQVKKWFNVFIKTIINNLSKFDNGYWSLYEQSNTKIPMITSVFYHKLHIIQLKILYNMTNEKIFNEYANKWTCYLNSRYCRLKSQIIKSIFKLIYF